MKKSTLYNLLGVLVVLLTIGGVVYVLKTSVKPAQVWEVIKTFPVFAAVLVLVLSSLMIVVRAYRFYLLLSETGIDISFWQALKVYVAGQALSPLPAGEGARSFLLKMETNVAVEDTITPLIMLGVTEMIVAVAISLIGSIFLGILRLAAIIALVGTVGLLWLLTHQKTVRFLFRLAPQKASVKKAERAVTSTQKEVRAEVFKSQRSWVPSRDFMINLLLALLTDIIGGFIIFTIAHYSNLSLGLLLSFYVFAAATVLGELVPFSPGGVGPTEGGMTGILILSGLTLSSSLAVVVLYRAATLLYGIVTGIIFMLLFYVKAFFTPKKRT